MTWYLSSIFLFNIVHFLLLHVLTFLEYRDLSHVHEHILGLKIEIKNVNSDFGFNSRF